MRGYGLMVVYHVTTEKLMRKYAESGCIRPPVRAWRLITSAERFSKQTGRRIILRFKFPDNAKTLGGHKGEAVVLHEPFNYPPKGGM